MPTTDRLGQWRNRIERTKRERRDLIRTWTDNVWFRRGKPFPTDSDQDRIYVNIDWSHTKTKHAALFSDVPQMRLTPKHQQFAQAVPVFARLLNDRLQQANIGAAIDESLLDTINASGIGACIVRFERRTQTVEIPTTDLSQVDPAMQMALLQSGAVQMEKVDQTTSYQYVIDRFSPSDMLWPVEYMRSDFDQSPWVGRSGTAQWAGALSQFGKSEERPNGLTEADKELVLTSRSKNTDETIRQDERDQDGESDLVRFDELYYRSALYDAEEPYLGRIKRLVFVEGLDRAVVDENWVGQEEAEGGGLLGSLRYPIQFLTLTYLTDDAIPPSDSAVARPQVLELMASRSQMVRNRERSIPIRWFDVSGIDPLLHRSLMSGTWQGMIPVNGDGNRAIGEVARAAYPPDDYTFDSVAKADLGEIWQQGPNQQAQFNRGRRSATEARFVQNNYESGLAYDRARVATYMTRIAEVMAGLIALYDPLDTLSDEDLQRLEGTWDRRTINNWFVYHIVPDAAVRLTSDQKIQRGMQLLNMLAPSGYLNIEPIIRDIVELAGYDPNVAVKAPQPASPQANLSYRFNGDDLANPLALAMAMQAGHAPTPDLVEAAKRALMAAQAPPRVPGAGGPAGPAGPGGPGAPPGAAPPPGSAGPPTAPPGLSVPPVDGNPTLETLPRINRRADESL